MQFGHEQLDVYRVSIRIRIVSMLTKLRQRNHEVRENPGRDDNLDNDNDNDNDNNDDNNDGAKGRR